MTVPPLPQFQKRINTVEFTVCSQVATALFNYEHLPLLDAGSSPWEWRSVKGVPLGPWWTTKS